MIVVPLTVEHAQTMQPQPWQAAAVDRLRDPALVRELTEGGQAFAAVDGDRVLAIGGLCEVENGSDRWIAWCWLAANLGAAMVGVTRAARRILQASRAGRIEIVTHADHRPGERWALLLGFDFEGPVRAYFAPRPGETRRGNGFMWSRVRYE